MTTNTLQHDIESGIAAGRVTMITPEMAEQWLNRNTHNRPIRQSRVDEYARDMAAGRWQMTGEAIKFDTDGALLDGQHRLWGIVEAGEPIRMMIVTGLAPESQSVMDTGAKRSAGDALHLGGIANGNIVAASAKLGIAYDAGNLRRARNIVNGRDVPTATHSEIRQWIDLNPGIVDAVRDTRRWPGRSKAAAAAALHVLSAIDAEEAGEFVGRIMNLNFRDDGGDPAKTLYERLIVSRTNRERLSSVTEMHMIFRAWNSERNGKRLSKLLIRNSATPFEVPR